MVVLVARVIWRAVEGLMVVTWVVAVSDESRWCGGGGSGAAGG